MLIARDLEAMLSDGELDRAAYSFDDLRAAVADSSSDVARQLAALGDAFTHDRIGDARTATQRLLTLLASQTS